MLVVIRELKYKSWTTDKLNEHYTYQGLIWPESTYQEQK